MRRDKDASGTDEAIRVNANQINKSRRFKELEKVSGQCDHRHAGGVEMADWTECKKRVRLSLHLVI